MKRWQYANFAGAATVVKRSKKSGFIAGAKNRHGFSMRHGQATFACLLYLCRVQRHSSPENTTVAAWLRVLQCNALISLALSHIRFLCHWVS